MKTYTGFPSQRSGNQWVGFKLLTAIPEVPVGHNSGENFLPSLWWVCSWSLPNPWCEQGETLVVKVTVLTPLSDGKCFELIPWGLKVSVLSPFLYHPLSPMRALTSSLGVTWPWLCTEVAEWNGPNNGSEEKSINQTCRCLGTCASGPLLLNWQS